MKSDPKIDQRRAQILYELGFGGKPETTQPTLDKQAAVYEMETPDGVYTINPQEDLGDDDIEF